MLIRKLYKFENAHIVRNCSSDRCKFSLHGHSYKIEVILEGSALDKGQMVYDFGLMKGTIKDFIDSFDHATAFWDKDAADYIEAIKTHSARWVSMPISPSAEQFSRFFFLLVDAVLANTVKNNGEQDVSVHSVIVHETDTGYAQAFREDVFINGESFMLLGDTIFSDQVMAEWSDPTMFEKLLTEEPFINPTVKQQVQND